MSGTDTNTFQGHSTCSASSSSARNLGVTIQKILDVQVTGPRKPHLQNFITETPQGVKLEGGFCHHVEICRK